MRSPLSRRHFLRDVAAGLSAAALPRLAQAEGASQPALTPGPPGRPGRHRVDEPVAVEVNARSLPSFDIRDRAKVRFGALEYRSGLILTSSFSGFGGLSALRLDARGERFIAVSDQGTWFTGRIVYRGRDMIGLDDVEAAPLLGADGRPITATRGWYDSESLALDGSIAYVGLERVNQVLRYDFAKGFTRARGEVVPLPPAARKLPINKGLEALVFVPNLSKGQALAGTLIAMSERGLDASGNLIAFLVGGKTPGQFSVRRTENFDISDAVLLPSGDLLILERKFSWLGGVGIRIRRLALFDIAPGAVVDGPAIFNADLGNEIDNMEGIDAHVTAEGETVLTMISDDNFSLIQRNLLLQFTLVE
ncbi:hypothetical protein FBZ93_104576 [Bradyrhizobium macuxiense]|uniref:Phytase-like domain-containing protein n=1 Tax=Bradyrhizobium macuxiense TaxID=1755647 RepID=A0A560M0W3_9BRAD|nr:esterase-like activity of phytase family protein [Bradyrhizobium macuxiense]TWC01297.1 hypothetical protein FBZ93_104576 [Bradyrhizobium macuxiense]